mmetsp:Transcript_61294/g.146088  ORF Transcript_61294/g.146088 Transcript_61294/m.146088 type:complete len:303 (-) Transcript_61294:17-925(-)
MRGLIHGRKPINCLFGRSGKALDPGDGGVDDQKPCIRQGHPRLFAQLDILSPEDGPLGIDAVVGAVGGSTREGMNVQQELQAQLVALDEERLQKISRDGRVGDVLGVVRVGDNHRVLVWIVRTVSLLVDDCEGICKESPHDRDSHRLDADVFHGLQVTGINEVIPVRHEHLRRKLLAIRFGKPMRQDALGRPRLLTTLEQRWETSTLAYVVAGGHEAPGKAREEPVFKAEPSSEVGSVGSARHASGVHFGTAPNLHQHRLFTGFALISCAGCGCIGQQPQRARPYPRRSRHRWQAALVLQTR